MMDDRFAIIETSGRGGHVALAQADRLVGQRQLDETGTRRHARDLAPALRTLLAEQGWSIRTLHGVIVGRGPGSYTGLRVGIMSAKTLAYAIGCKLYAIDTFAAIAAQAPAEVLAVDVIADAQQGRVYFQPFVRGSTRAAWQAAAALGITTLDMWLERRSEQAWISGPGVDIFAARLPTDRLVEAVHRQAHPGSLLALAWARHRHGQTDEVYAVEPLYLRASAAEEQWRQRRQTQT
jgi:tRNA threonylcarbamoyladenosine biosynthesis protein TsaB